MCCIIWSAGVYGQVLSVTTTGVLDFNHGFSSLNEAGSDFQSPIVSSSSLYLSIQYADWLNYIFRPDKQWRIAVNKEDVNWHNKLSVEVMRNGEGSRILSWLSVQKPLNGGTNYIEVPNNATTFFEGEHGFSNIEIKVRLVGASVTMGAGDYSTTIYFTVYDR